MKTARALYTGFSICSMPTAVARASAVFSFDWSRSLVAISSSYVRNSCHAMPTSSRRRCAASSIASSRSPSLGILAARISPRSSDSSAALPIILLAASVGLGNLLTASTARWRRRQPASRPEWSHSTGTKKLLSTLTCCLAPRILSERPDCIAVASSASVAARMSSSSVAAARTSSSCASSASLATASSSAERAAQSQRMRTARSRAMKSPCLSSATPVGSCSGNAFTAAIAASRPSPSSAAWSHTSGTESAAAIERCLGGFLGGAVLVEPARPFFVERPSFSDSRRAASTCAAMSCSSSDARRTSSAASSGSKAMSLERVPTNLCTSSHASSRSIWRSFASRRAAVVRLSAAALFCASDMRGLGFAAVPLPAGGGAPPASILGNASRRMHARTRPSESMCEWSHGWPLAFCREQPSLNVVSTALAHSSRASRNSSQAALTSGSEISAALSTLISSVATCCHVFTLSASTAERPWRNLMYR
mmetsp:Transcript_46453/g.121946  ORF Transcript_46453/g.121946 Transcript_46453/m.121946 type:complete len:481 (-) Transcript_46453:131-1573(-)